MNMNLVNNYSSCVLRLVLEDQLITLIAWMNAGIGEFFIQGKEKQPDSHHPKI